MDEGSVRVRTEYRGVVEGRNVVRCKGCGEPIIFVRTQAGKSIPLDLGVQVYHVAAGRNGSQVAVRSHTGYVNHLEVCPKANDLRRQKKG